MEYFLNKLTLGICIVLYVLITKETFVFSYNVTNFNTTLGRQIMRLSKSAEMRNYMKPEMDACKDFYQYACGNWAKINPALTEPKTGIFNILSKAFDRKALKILQETESLEDTETDKKVKNFYESCMQRYEIKDKYSDNILNLLEEFGGMPALKGSAWKESEFDWLETIAQILRKYGSKIIMGIDISPDLTNNEINRLFIGQLDDLITGKSDEYYVALTLVYQMQLQSVLGLSSAQASNVSRQITGFAQQLASGMIDPKEGLSIEDKTRLTSVDEMTENYGPTINFTHFATTWLGYDYRLPVYEYVENYIKNLHDLVRKTPREVLANYILWELLQDFRLESQKTKKKHTEKCIEITKKHFVKYFNKLIYKKLLNEQPEIIEEIKSMWQQLKFAFENILLSSSSGWMVGTTKNKALEKLLAMTIEINGYEDVNFQHEYGALNISSGEFFENLQNILLLRGNNYRVKLQEPPKLEEHKTLSFTPAYVAEYNRVILPVAFLQPRYLWDDVYPKALKYGTMGYIMAHEMAHGFDDTIRKFDAKGNINNWWDRNASAVFDARIECLRQQYGQYKFGRELLPKSQAQGENIADNVGIRIAYTAYEMWLSEHSHTPEHLPNMDSINARQLFFISTAQMWCTDINKIFHHILISIDVHPPEEVRVRAMFANFDAFAETFQCQLGSEMHPLMKCIIF